MMKFRIVWLENKEENFKKTKNLLLKNGSKKEEFESLQTVGIV